MLRASCRRIPAQHTQALKCQRPRNQYSIHNLNAPGSTSALSKGISTNTTPATFDASSSRALFTSSKRPSPRDSDPGQGSENRVSDREWEIRTGRAIDILQETLPSFFSTGLLSTGYHLPLGSMHGILDMKGKSRESDGEHEEDAVGIYSQSIRLEYTPPSALPTPFPRVLTLEGLPLYVASSVFVRHTLNALYTDLRVITRKAAVNSAASQFLSNDDALKAGPRGRRELAFVVNLLVAGQGRLGTKEAEWDVSSTYTFSPLTGLITKHTVNSIDPAPHETVYSALRGSLSKLGLLGYGDTETGTGNAMIPGKLKGVMSMQVNPTGADKHSGKD